MEGASWVQLLVCQILCGPHASVPAHDGYVRHHQFQHRFWCLVEQEFECNCCPPLDLILLANAAIIVANKHPQ
eukprot:9466046-Karenia_brevis.AAC.1